MTVFFFFFFLGVNSGDVPRVDGQLAVARAFGDKSLKKHLSSEPDVEVVMIDDDTEFIILASDGLWKVIPLSISGIATFDFTSTSLCKLCIE